MQRTQFLNLIIKTMKKNQYNNTSSNSNGSGQYPENNKGKSTIKPTSSLTKSDTGNSVMNERKMENIISVNKDTDLDQLGKDLTTDPKYVNFLKTILKIDNAKLFKIAEIEKLGKIIKNLPFKVCTFISEDNDMTELAMTILCSNDTYFIEEEVKITMETLELLSDEELKRISEVIAKFTGKDAEEIMKCYQNKDIIDLSMILREKNKK
jgi:hypothetical protein